MADVEARQWARLLGVSVDASPPDICRAFERLAKQRLAPRDLKPWPLYCLPLSSIPALRHAASLSCDGFFNELGYHLVRNHLQKVRQDRGYGPVLFVRDFWPTAVALRAAEEASQVFAAIGEDVPVEELLDLAAGVHTIDKLCSVAIHELAHAIDSIAAGNFGQTAEFADCDALRFVAESRHDQFIEAAQQNPSPPSDQADWAHSLQFVRVLCHLRHRLDLAGVATGRHVAPSHNYGHAPLDECYAALQSEMRRSSDRSFAEILQRRPPRSFRQLAAAWEQLPAALPA